MNNYDKLCEVVDRLRPYYDIDKIKPWSVYVWSKTNSIDDSENLFDIMKNDIICYGNFRKENIIIDCLDIIKEIQKYLEE